MSTTGAEIARAYVTVYTKMPGVKKEVTEALGGVDTSKAGSTIGQKLSSGISKAVKIGAAGVVGVLGTALVKGFGRLKAIETAQAKMKGLGYDTKTVAKAMDNALASVKGTAFGLGDAATAAGQLMAANIKPGKDLEGVLKTVANNAAAAGTTFDEMGSIFARAASQANGVQNDVISQLADRGIPIYQALADQMGVTAGEVFKLASQGKIDFATFSAAATAAAGTVADEIGNTTTGAFDNMMAALGRLGAKLLEDVFPLIGPLFKEITAGLDNAQAYIEPAVSWLGERLPIAIQKTRNFFTGLFSWVSSNKDWLMPVIVGVGTLIAAIKTAQFVTAAWKGAIAAFKAVQTAYTAYTYGMAGATYTYEGASKAGAVATKIFNAALKANPIGLIVTAVLALVAGLVWFFTQTETGKKIWAEFTRFLGEAWANVSQFFKTVWEQYLKPVFEAIGAIATWVWENILKPIFDAFAIGFAILAGILQGIWEFILKPVFDAIGAVFSWLWDTIIKVIIDFIVAYVKVWAAIFTWLWENVLSPIFATFGKIFNWIYNVIIKPIIDAIVIYVKVWASIFTWLWNNAIKPVVDAVARAFTWLYENVIRPVWDWIQKTISDVWNNKIKPVIDTLSKVIKNDPKKAFEAARDAIGKAWAGIQDLAKKPVKFVVETVINGLIGTINKIPGVNIPKVPLPKGFAGGGILPGRSRMSQGDDQLIAARRGEGIMVSEALRSSADRAAFLAVNAAGRRGVGFASLVQGLAKGGLVHPMPGAIVTTEWMGYPGHRGIDLAKPAGTPIRSAASGAVSFSGWYGGGGNMAAVQHGGGLETRYKHMIARPIVNVGQFVKQGQTLGYEGSTGDSTGPHLHYEVIKGGVWQNPRPYLNGSGDAGLFDIIGGLTKSVMKQFTDKFPGSEMFVSAAGGILKQGVESVVEWARSKLSIGGGISPRLYDSGGWLNPGLNLVENRSGRPEPVLTGAQWDDLLGSRESGIAPGTRLRLVVEDGSEFNAYIDDRASGVVDGKFSSTTPGAVTSRFGGRRR